MCACRGAYGEPPRTARGLGAAARKRLDDAWTLVRPCPVPVPGGLARPLHIFLSGCRPQVPRVLDQDRSPGRDLLPPGVELLWLFAFVPDHLWLDSARNEAPGVAAGERFCGNEISGGTFLPG